MEIQVVSFERVKATHPGKHGVGDWRVELKGIAPTHAELLFMLGMVLQAEARYDRPVRGEANGRDKLWYWVDLASQECVRFAKTPERILEISEALKESIASSKRAKSNGQATYRPGVVLAPPPQMTLEDK